MLRGLVLRGFVLIIMLLTGSNLLASQYPDAIDELVYIKDVKTLEQKLNATDLSSDEVLHLMVYSCEVNNDKELLSVIQDNKQSSTSLNDNQLHDAIYYLLNNDKADCVVPLAKQVDNPSVYTRYGESLLHWAAFHQNHELTDYLIEEGVDVDLVDSGNKKALDYAIENLDMALAKKIVIKTDLNSKMPYVRIPYVYPVLDLINMIREPTLKHEFLRLVLNDSKSSVESKLVHKVINLPICTSDDVTIKICKEALGVE